MLLRRMGILDAQAETHAGETSRVEDIGVHAAAGGPETGFDADGTRRTKGIGHYRMGLRNDEGLERRLPPDGQTGAGGRRRFVKGRKDRLDFPLQLFLIGAPDLDGHLRPVGNDVPRLAPADDADVRGGLGVDAAGAETGDGRGGRDDGVDPLLGTTPAWAAFPSRTKSRSTLEGA